MGNRDSNSSDESVGSIDDDEMSSLMGSRKKYSSRSDKSISALSTGVFANCICFLLFLGVFVFFGMRYQSSISEMENKIIELDARLSSEESRTAKLELDIGEHQKVIDRFNNITTNKELSDKVDSLEHEFVNTTTFLVKEVNDTKESLEQEMTEIVEKVEQETTNTTEKLEQEMSITVGKLESELAQTKGDIANQLSLTKADVQRNMMNTKNTIEKELVDTTINLEKEMANTTAGVSAQIKTLDVEVRKELYETMHEFNVSVSNAEKIINGEVDRVKMDVESYVKTTQATFAFEFNFMVYQLALTFMLLSCLISMWHMTAHLRKFKEPVVQRKILAILWMVPIYGTTSWVSLVIHQAEPYLSVLKDFYEAYIIYQFLSFCICVLGRGDRDKVIDLMVKRADNLTPPFRFDGFCYPNPYESDRALAEAVLLQCQSFAMQFVFFRPLTTVLLFMLDEMNYQSPSGSTWDYRSPQLYITAIQNISVFIAFTGLLKFYHAVDKELAWCRPFAKFLCIKGVIFMTFWQGIVINILVSTTKLGGDNQDKWANQVQNFLLCFEMLLFSIAHFYSFPTAEWQEGYRKMHEKKGKFSDTIAFGDFFQDMKLIMSNKKKKNKRKPRKNNNDDDSSFKGAILEEDASTEEYCKEVSVSDFQKALEHVDDDTIDKINQLADLMLLQDQVKIQEEMDIKKTTSIDETSGEEDQKSSEEEDQKSSDEEDQKPTEHTTLLRNNKTNEFYGGSSQEADEESCCIKPETSNQLKTSKDVILRPSIFTTIDE